MDEKSLVMEIAEVHQIPGVGTCVIGVVECERISFQDKVLIQGVDFAQEVLVGGVEKNPRDSKGSGIRGNRGENVGMLLVGDRSRELIAGVQIGMKVFTARDVPSPSITPTTHPKQETRANDAPRTILDQIEDAGVKAGTAAVSVLAALIGLANLKHALHPAVAMMIGGALGGVVGYFVLRITFEFINPNRKR